MALKRQFDLTIHFNFEKLVYHHKQSNGKSIAIAVLEKDYNFRWGKFYRSQTNHNNVMMSPHVLHDTKLLLIKR